MRQQYVVARVNWEYNDENDYKAGISEDHAVRLFPSKEAAEQEVIEETARYFLQNRELGRFDMYGVRRSLARTFEKAFNVEIGEIDLWDLQIPAEATLEQVIEFVKCVPEWNQFAALPVEA